MAKKRFIPQARWPQNKSWEKRGKKGFPVANLIAGKDILWGGNWSEQTGSEVKSKSNIVTASVAV